WEIADIAIFVIVRKSGRLLARKVALLQTKRLYSKGIAVTELEHADYVIGIGRLADRTDHQVPLTHQRAFSFDEDSIYAELQSRRIDRYMKDRGIPVYYGFYNPLVLPYADKYPVTLESRKKIRLPMKLVAALFPPPTFTLH